MPKILVYTFRTFPYRNELTQEFKEVFILDKLKQDIEILCKKIQQEKPDYILGVAKYNKSLSGLASSTINQFNKNNKVVKSAPDSLSLHVPKIQNTKFRLAGNPTRTFCNYSMYKIQYFLNQNNTNIPHSFIRTGKTNIKFLKSLFKHP